MLLAVVIAPDVTVATPLDNVTIPDAAFVTSPPDCSVTSNCGEFAGLGVRIAAATNGNDNVLLPVQMICGV